MSECAICNGWGVDDTTGFACSSCGTVKQSLMVEPVRSPEELGAAMQTDAATALKPAVEVWQEARQAYHVVSNPYPSAGADAAAAVIEADRAAIIAAKDAEIAALREALKAERLKPCRHTQTAEGETQRPDIHAWQEAQSEWFNPTILGIVAEYAAHRDQTDGLAALQAHADALAEAISSGHGATMREAARAYEEFRR